MSLIFPDFLALPSLISSQSKTKKTSKFPQILIPLPLKDGQLWMVPYKCIRNIWMTPKQEEEEEGGNGDDVDRYHQHHKCEAHCHCALTLHCRLYTITQLPSEELLPPPRHRRRPLLFVAPTVSRWMEAQAADDRTFL